LPKAGKTTSRTPKVIPIGTPVKTRSRIAGEARAPAARPATPKEPVRSWRKITSATDPIPTGSRASTEAEQRARTLG
jgi:hypothetical protein